MYARIIDESNPRYRGPLPKPRGLLPVPPEIAEEVSRDQAAHQPNYSDDYAKLTRNNWTLTYYYEGETVACRSTADGVEVLAVGPEEVRRFYQETPPENRQAVMIQHPSGAAPMSRLEVPLQQRTLRATRDTVIWADLVLSFKTNRGAWEEVPFRVDSGTEMTTMPAYDAKSLDLPIPTKPVSNLLLYGQEVRSGLLRHGSSVWT